MNINSKTPLSSIVAHNYKTAHVLKQYNLDFCCNGDRPLEVACRADNIPVEKVISELNQCLEDEHEEHDYQSWDIAKLSDHIYNKHHRYVENAIPNLKQYLAKIVQVHGQSHPELAEIRAIFTQAVSELVLHMKKEEFILFPYFKKLEQARKTGQNVTSPQFKRLATPIAVMQEEHDTEGIAFRKIAELSNYYTPPAAACPTYRLTFTLLKEFEDDLHKHIHLENNILFKKAMSIEAQLQAEAV